MTLLCTSIHTVLLRRNTFLSHFSSTAVLFTSFAVNAAKSFISFSCTQHQPQGWSTSKVEEAVGEIREAFAFARRNDEKRQTCISTSRQASSVIVNAKAWHVTCLHCSATSSRFEPKSVYSILRSVACSASFFSSNFPYYTSP